jgi:serine/threonine-protein kinase
MVARPDSPNIGKYRFLVELGSGGMGDVLLAVAQGPKGFNKLQVIKRLRPELAQDPEFLAMFLNEARIAARLNHPNVVQTNEVSEHEDEYFIAMEYLEGQSLYGVMKRAQSLQAKGGKPFPMAMHLHVLAEACEGLHYAHELVDYDGTPLQLVHRDCSPQNVFVTYDGEVKVLDFGIAKAADSATMTRTGVLKGKVPYMPPEQLDGTHVDRRADIFAIGAMIWEAATGVRLWKGLNDIQIAHRLHQKDIPTPSSFEPTVDPKLEPICMKAQAERPHER